METIQEPPEIKIGFYTLVKPLGSGRFGNVYLSSREDEYYALKVEDMESEYNTLQHEAYMLHRLNRNKVKHIPLLFWYSSDEPHRYLATDYFEGHSLDVLYQTITWNNVTDWFETAVNIVTSVHRANIIHRDLKPKHFIFHQNRQWKLIDFGLAGPFDEQDVTVQGSNIFGTPKYISFWIHEGFPPSKRDDIITVVYIFIDLYLIHHKKPRLSWFVPNAFQEEWKSPVDISRLHVDHPYNKQLKNRKKWNVLISWLQKQGVPQGLVETVKKCSQWNIHDDALL